MPTSDDYARATIRAGRDLGISVRGIKIGLATNIVEVGYPLKMYANSKVPESLKLPHDAVGSDGLSVGTFQQQIRRGTEARTKFQRPDIEAGEIPLVVPGPVLERMAERQLSTGVRVGTDWVAEDVGVKVLPQWQRQGLDQEREARPDPVAPWDGALPENAGAAVSLADLKKQHGGA